MIGKGWTEAIEIEIGDEVLLQDGTTAVITDKFTELLDKTIKVYNFTVDDFHTYFVGENSVLVHNSCGSVDIGDNDKSPNLDNLDWTNTNKKGQTSL